MRDDARSEAEHSQALGQLLGRPVKINVLFEPVQGDVHTTNEGGRYWGRNNLPRRYCSAKPAADERFAEAGADVHERMER